MIIKLPFEPVAQARPRLTTRGRYPHAYDPPKSKAYKQQVKRFAKQQMHGKPPSERPLVVVANFYRKIPKGFSNKKRQEAEAKLILPQTKPDIDNYLKGLLDGLNGVVWKDDNQIVALVACKFYSDEPRTEIVVQEIESGQQVVEEIKQIIDKSKTS